MAKEWALNSLMNRGQFNYKRNVGCVMEEIRKCAPKVIGDWKKYYFNNVRSEDHIKNLGCLMYKSVNKILLEIQSITEKDCIEYINKMVIDRSFDGYNTEIKIIIDQLEKILNIKIKETNEWDSLYNVDFFIKVGDSYIGLQIKPVYNGSHISQIFKERSIQKETHKKFTEKYRGEVFYIFSIKENNNKKIHNKEVISNIEVEIDRLKNLK